MVGLSRLLHREFCLLFEETLKGAADSLGLFPDRLNLTADAFRYFEEHVSCAVVEQFVAVAFVAYGGVFH